MWDRYPCPPIYNDLLILHSPSSPITPPPILFHTTSYDFMWLIRCVTTLGNTTVKVPTNFGTFHEKRLLVQPAKLVMRNANSAISCRFRFTCVEPDCQPCILKSKNKFKNDTPRHLCPTESREFIFFDSFLHFNAGLGKCIDDLRNVAYQTDIPLSKQFPSTFNFATIHCNYSHSQFLEIVKGKLIFPFNYSDSIEHLQNTKFPPKKEEFTDKLSDNTEISQSDYDHFCNLWSSLGFRSLLDCLWVYNLLDSGKYQLSIPSHICIFIRSFIPSLIHPVAHLLVACTQLYTPLCRSVGRPVGPSVGPSVGRSVRHTLLFWRF